MLGIFTDMNRFVVIGHNQSIIERSSHVSPLPPSTTTCSPKSNSIKASLISIRSSRKYIGTQTSSIFNTKLQFSSFVFSFVIFESIVDWCLPLTPLISLTMSNITQTKIKFAQLEMSQKSILNLQIQKTKLFLLV